MNPTRKNLARTLIAVGALMQFAACEGAGDVTTPTPVAGDSDTSNFNVVLEDCELTAGDLADAVGADSVYEEIVQGDARLITANGVANHDVDAFPNDGNPNSIVEQSYTYQVPVSPSGAGEVLTGVFGIATSGVVLDPGTAERYDGGGDWNYEALRYGGAPGYFDTDSTFHPDSLGLDCNFAHVQPDGSYHYHGVPTGLVPESPELAFVGWAADGYPIFGRWGHEDANDPSSPLVEMRASYELRDGERTSGPGGAYDGTFTQDWEYQAGLGDLDECNGRVGVVTIDGEQVETYHYYLTYTFPYIPRCFQAAPDPSFDRGAPGGGTDTGAPGMGPPPGM